MPIVITAGDAPDITLVEIRWTSTYFDGLPALGHLYVEMSENRVIDIDANEESIAVLSREVVYPITPTIVTQLNEASVPTEVEVGLAEFSLPASDDTDLFGTPFTYRIREELLLGGGGIYEITVPVAAEGTGLDLSRASATLVGPAPVRNQASGESSLGYIASLVRRAEIAANLAESEGGGGGGLAAPTDAGMYYTSIGTSGRWRPADHADVRDFATSTSGTFGTGDADKDTACILEAIDEMAAESAGVQIGGRPVFIPAGVAHLAAPVVRTVPVPVHGASMGRTVIKTTPDLDGEWMWTDDDLNRDGAWVLNDETYDPLVYKGGGELRNLTFLHDQALSGRYHGYRTRNSCDDLRHQGLQILYFNGTGYQLGDPDPSIDGSGGTVREAMIVDLRVMECGDETAGFDAWVVTQADDPMGAGDGTNQVNFIAPWFVYNHGKGRVGTSSATEVLRRVSFTNMMLHGPGTLTLEDDLMVIEGRVSGLNIMGLRTNSSSLGYACIRWREQGGTSPVSQQVSGFTVATTAGSAFAIDDVQSLILQGTTGPGGIDQYEVTIAADSTVSPGSPAIGSGLFDIVTSSVTRKLNIPTNAMERITLGTGWDRRKSATTTNLASITDQANVVGKRTGQMVFNSQTDKPVWATGPAAADVWVDATGATVHTPV